MTEEKKSFEAPKLTTINLMQMANGLNGYSNAVNKVKSNTKLSDEGKQEEMNSIRTFQMTNASKKLEESRASLQKKVEYANEKVSKLYNTDADYNKRSYDAIKAQQVLSYMDDIEDFKDYLGKCDDTSMRKELLQLASFKWRDQPERIKQAAFDTMSDDEKQARYEAAYYQSIENDLNNIEHFYKEDIKTIEEGRKPMGEYYKYIGTDRTEKNLQDTVFENYQL